MSIECLFSLQLKLTQIEDHLLRTAFNAITRLKQQKGFFPNELRDVYVSWRERVAQWNREDLIERLVAG